MTPKKQYLVLDTETTGLGIDKSTSLPYSDERAPLPRENYPMEVSAKVVDEEGKEVASFHSLIQGAMRLDPWVKEHCSHLSPEKCEQEGISFRDAVTRLSSLVSGDTTLVAHNMRYDWDMVLLRTAREEGMEEDPSFRLLSDCPRFDTMLNSYTKTTPVRGRSAFYWKKEGVWIGPSLANLAFHFGVDFDPSSAHDATYDVEVTTKCLLHLLSRVR